MSSPRPDGLRLDFQDSQDSCIHASGVELQVRLSAAHVLCPEVRFAQAPEETEGYLAPLVLVLRQARWQGELALAMGRMLEGEVWLDGQRLRRLPLPCSSGVPVRAGLAFANGLVLAIAAAAQECPLGGNEKFTLSLAC